MNATHTVKDAADAKMNPGTMFTAWVAIFFALISPCARRQRRPRRRNSAPGGQGPRPSSSRCLVVRLFVWLLRGRCGAPRSPSRAFEPLQPPRRRLSAGRVIAGPICARCRFKYASIGLFRVNGGQLIQQTISIPVLKPTLLLVFCNQFILREERRAALPRCAARFVLPARIRQRPLRARRPRRTQLPRTGISGA